MQHSFYMGAAEVEVFHAMLTVERQFSASTIVCLNSGCNAQSRRQWQKRAFSMPVSFHPLRHSFATHMLHAGTAARCRH